MINDDLMKQSWRYVSPSRAKSENYNEAFQLRIEDGKREEALSFYVNSSFDLGKDERRTEILKIFDEKFKLGYSKNARFIMVNLVEAIAEINLNGKKLISAEIDSFPHCSAKYENGSYDNDILRAEVMLSLYYSIYDDFSIAECQQQETTALLLDK